MTPPYPAPAPPYLGPAAHTSPGSNLPIRRIVLHSTVSKTQRGGARSIAAYFRSKGSGGSAHYVVDPYEVVQVVGDSMIAWHAPPNAHSIGVEMCDMPVAGNSARWDDEAHLLLEERAAALVADLCLAYDVPPYFVGAVGLAAGRKGVTIHAEVSKAFRQSSHWDVGAWRRYRFMKKVRALYKSKKAAHVAATRKKAR